jgi:hypothetical protein
MNGEVIRGHGAAMKAGIAGAALATGLLAGIANAADYFVVIRDRQTLAVFEVSTLKRNGPVASVVATMARPEPFRIVDKRVSFITSRTELDCEKRLTRTVSPTLHNADGSVIRAMDHATEWKSPIPKSIGDLMLTAVCDPASRTKPVEDWEAPRDIVYNYRLAVADADTD